MLLESPLHRLPDGRIMFVYDKSTPIYVENYTDDAIEKQKKAGKEPTGVAAEMTILAETFGYLCESDNDSLTFSLKSSIELKERCLHYSYINVLTLSHIQNYWTIIASIKDQFEDPIPNDFWSYIFNYLIKLIITELDPTSILDSEVYIDQTDRDFVTNTRFYIPPPTQFLLPGEDGQCQILEIPLDEEVYEEAEDHIDLRVSLNAIKQKINQHEFKCHGGGKRMNGKIYSNAAVAILNHIDTALSKEGLSRGDYHDVMDKVKNELNNKRVTTYGFFCLGSRDQSTVDLYNDLFTDSERELRLVI